MPLENARSWTVASLSALILLLLVLDPFGEKRLRPSCIPGVDAGPCRRRAAHAGGATRGGQALLRFGVLLAFAFLGESGFLQVTHLSRAFARKWPGGVILMIIAGAHDRLVAAATRPTAGWRKARPGPSILPLAVPLLAGPTAMATVLLPASLLRGSRTADRRVDRCAVRRHVGIRRRVAGRPHPQSRRATRSSRRVEKLMGLVLTAIAVEMVLAG